MFGKSKAENTVWEKFPELKSIPKNKFPRHLLLIPDGNGRWASLAHKNISEGHKAGADVIKKIYNDLWQLPIEFITIWGFSANNWSRTREEADGIMKVIDQTLKVMLPSAIERNARIIHIGRKDRIPKYLKVAFENAEKITENNKKSYLCLAVDFGGQDQEVRMMKRMVEDRVKNITPEILNSYRDGGGIVPPADLVVRTSGEKRTSDLGWLSINSELSFIQKLLPKPLSRQLQHIVSGKEKKMIWFQHSRMALIVNLSLN